MLLRALNNNGVKLKLAPCNKDFVDRYEDFRQAWITENNTLRVNFHPIGAMWTLFKHPELPSNESLTEDMPVRYELSVRDNGGFVPLRNGICYLKHEKTSQGELFFKTEIDLNPD